jgi:hypothetical protein
MRHLAFKRWAVSGALQAHHQLLHSLVQAIRLVSWSAEEPDGCQLSHLGKTRAAWRTFPPPGMPATMICDHICVNIFTETNAGSSLTSISLHSSMHSMPPKDRASALHQALHSNAYKQS